MENQNHRKGRSQPANNWYSPKLMSNCEILNLPYGCIVSTEDFDLEVENSYHGSQIYIPDTHYDSKTDSFVRLELPEVRES